MQEIISDDLRERLRSVCDPCDVEVCGFVLSDMSIVMVDNIASDPNHYFAMDPDDVLRVWNGDVRPWAVFHSHPNGTNWWSVRDIRFTVPNLVNILVPRGKELVIFDPADVPSRIAASVSRIAAQQPRG